MLTLLIALGAFAGYIIAYHTYGRWLSKKIFNLDPEAEVPSRQLRDDVDFVPTKKSVIFGHHFTSIAGTGPIVGPAIAVFWGWLPALVWVLFGSIFIGAVHDFGALVVSLRNRGQTVGEVAGRLINPRARILFLLILFFALTIVLAIFGLVIATIFNLYPESVLSVWVAMPLAVGVGYWVYRGGGQLLLPSVLALGVLYAAVYLGVYHLPITLPVDNPVVVWTIVLMAYCFLASVLPVWVLLQPRDYINSHQLIVALGLLVLGVLVAGFTGQVDLAASAPAVASTIPIGAPPIWPFLFITIACGAVSGFHCLVSSGTTSKQIANEPDAQYVAYGSMLLEGALAVLVILACCAGVGMGKFDRQADGSYQATMTAAGTHLVGREAWVTRYDSQKGWSDFGLGAKVGAFIEGGANFVSTLGVPLELAIGLIAVLVACFAATTLDTATRLQRYVTQELAATMRITLFTNKYAATALVVFLGGAMAMIPAPGKDAGTGGLILWPLFGATNQLLAGLALMVTVFYLWRRNKPIWFVLAPMIVMLIMPVWALLWQLFNQSSGWFWPLSHMISGQTAWQWQNTHLLFSIGVAVMALQIWMVIEGILLWSRAKGVLEEALPPLETVLRPSSVSAEPAAATSGPNC
jgi:carbon starvation protein